MRSSGCPCCSSRWRCSHPAIACAWGEVSRRVLASSYSRLPTPYSLFLLPRRQTGDRQLGHRLGGGKRRVAIDHPRKGAHPLEVMIACEDLRAGVAGGDVHSNLPSLHGVRSEEHTSELQSR